MTDRVQKLTFSTCLWFFFASFSWHSKSCYWLSKSAIKNRNFSCNTCEIKNIKIAFERFTIKKNICTTFQAILLPFYWDICFSMFLLFFDRYREIYGLNITKNKHTLLKISLNVDNRPKISVFLNTLLRVLCCGIFIYSTCTHMAQKVYFWFISIQIIHKKNKKKKNHKIMNDFISLFTLF